MVIQGRGSGSVAFHADSVWNEIADSFSRNAKVGETFEAAAAVQEAAGDIYR